MFLGWPFVRICPLISDLLKIARMIKDTIYSLFSYLKKMFYFFIFRVAMNLSILQKCVLFSPDYLSYRYIASTFTFVYVFGRKWRFKEKSHLVPIENYHWETVWTNLNFNKQCSFQHMYIVYIIYSIKNIDMSSYV